MNCTDAMGVALKGRPLYSETCGGALAYIHGRMVFLSQTPGSPVRPVGLPVDKDPVHLATDWEIMPPRGS